VATIYGLEYSFGVLMKEMKIIDFTVSSPDLTARVTHLYKIKIIK